MNNKVVKESGSSQVVKSSTTLKDTLTDEQKILTEGMIFNIQLNFYLISLVMLKATQVYKMLDKNMATQLKKRLDEIE